jgi:hypothetical protein
MQHLIAQDCHGLKDGVLLLPELLFIDDDIAMSHRTTVLEKKKENFTITT